MLGWNGPSLATSGLIKYTMDTNTWTNGTGPDPIRRAEGAMVYIPASDGGALIYFGGLQDPSGNGSIVGQPMEQIFVYDILSSKWYTQNATGTVPAMREKVLRGRDVARGSVQLQYVSAKTHAVGSRALFDQKTSPLIQDRQLSLRWIRLPAERLRVR